MASYVNGTATLVPAVTSVGIQRLEQQLDVLECNSTYLLRKDSERDADPDWMGLIFSEAPQCSSARASGIFYEGYSDTGESIEVYYRGRSNDGVDFFTELCNLIGFDAVLTYVWEGESNSNSKTIIVDGSRFYPEALKELPVGESEPMYSQQFEADYTLKNLPRTAVGVGYNWFSYIFPDYYEKLSAAIYKPEVEAVIQEACSRCYRGSLLSSVDQSKLRDSIRSITDNFFASRNKHHFSDEDWDSRAIFTETQIAAYGWVGTFLFIKQDPTGSVDEVLRSTIEFCIKHVTDDDNWEKIDRVMYALQALTIIALPCDSADGGSPRQLVTATVAKMSLNKDNAPYTVKSVSDCCAVSGLDFTKCSSLDIDREFMCGWQLSQSAQYEGLDSAATAVTTFYSAYCTMRHVNPSGEYNTDLLAVKRLFVTMYSDLCDVNAFIQSWKMNNQTVVAADSDSYFKRVFSLLDGAAVFDSLDITATCDDILCGYSKLTPNVAGLLQKMMRAESRILEALAPVNLYIPDISD